MNTTFPANAAVQRLLEDGVVAGPAPNGAIAAAEAGLGVTFPDQYRDFLERYGAALIGGVEIYGIVDASKNDPPLWQDVRTATGRLREHRQVGTENAQYLLISEDGTGVYFYLNTGAAPDVEVWAIGPGVRRAVSKDLYEFVLDVAGGRLTP